MAQLLQHTGAEKYRTLLQRYYRQRLFTPLLEGKDVLTNMHANTTIPEVLGCARAYEVTGEQRWRDIVEAYWKLAVDQRGPVRHRRPDQRGNLVRAPGAGRPAGG